MKYYIAYGSNLSVFQMMHRCPDARIIGKAVLKDWKLVFRIHATIEPEIGYNVPVLVWKISEEDEARLDRYEGYPRYYIKRDLKVNVTGIHSGKTREITGMVYIMTEGCEIIPPTPEYYGIIMEGYRRFRFDTDILRSACMEAYMRQPVADT